MSQLTDTMALFYRMQEADRDRLAGQLLDQRKRAWDNTLRAEAAQHDCNQLPNPPKAGDLSDLKRMSSADAASIAETWNADVLKQAEALYLENPRGNRYYYANRLESWAQERSVWKMQQIALNTELTTTEYARARFRELNYGDDTRYIFAGPPPTCEDCARRFAAGVVDRRYIDLYPTPRHINCPHFWKPTKRPKIDCQDLWLG